MIFPTISIAIATFNSQKTLPKTLESIRKQSYPPNKIEILIIDGRSTDATKDIAKKYNCKIIQNPRVDLIYAKRLGFIKAEGKYLMYLDSDEVLENPDSLKLKVSAFQKDDRIKAVVPSGYKTPEGSSFINHYINEFGDPFSFFMYRESKGKNYLVEDFLKKYQKIYENNNFIVLSFINSKFLPLLEFWAGGCMIDLPFLRSNFPEIEKNTQLIAHLFYLFNNQKVLIAITKKDSTIHYSSESLSKYLKKIISRIKNNVYLNDMGWGGFVGRQYYQPIWFRLKKYLFIPYSLSIILPTFDAIYLSLSRRKLFYFIHLPLCIFTSLLIIYFYFLKIFGIRSQSKSYGN